MPRAESSGQPTWIHRRELLLQRACNCVSDQLQSGVRIGRAISEAARRFGNADLGSGHRLALSDKHLHRIWRRYLKLGAAAFKFKYSFGPRDEETTDPVLLRLVVEHCLQSGASLEEAIEAIQPPGAARLTIKKIYRAVPKRALDSFSTTHRALLKHRRKLEKSFLRSAAAIHRRFLKSRREWEARILHQDALLQRRLLRQREMLQNKFLAADARAVKKREQLQGQVLRAMFRPSP